MIRRRPEHDPERHAAAYVAGELRARLRRSFEDHLIECEDCWREVRLGREGRRRAESARELAPAGLREDVRAAVTLSEGAPGPRRRLLVSTVAILSATTVVLASFALLRRPGQPPPIAAALASYRSSGPTGASPAGRAAPDLRGEGLELSSSGHVIIGGMPVDAFGYRSSSGARVLLFFSSSVFPQASGATERTGSVHGWVSQEGGLSLVCGDRPVSYLLVGEDTSLLRSADAALRRAMSVQSF